MDAYIEQIAKSLYFSCKQFDIGLFYGKMGRCLFFFDYSRVTELRAFEELAGELLDGECLLRDAGRSVFRMVWYRLGGGISGPEGICGR